MEWIGARFCGTEAGRPRVTARVFPLCSKIAVSVYLNLGIEATTINFFFNSYFIYVQYNSFESQGDLV